MAAYGAHKPSAGVNDDTDDYIHRTLQVNRLDSPRTRYTGGADYDPGVENDPRRPLTGANKPVMRVVGIRQTPRSFVGRIVLAALGVAFFGLGGLLIISAIGAFSFFQYLLPLVFWPPIGCAVFSIVLGAVAFLSGCLRFRSLTFTTIAVAFLLAGAGIAASVVTVMLSDGKLQSGIATKWNHTVTDHHKAVCDFQTQFSCRGWITPCGLAAAEASHSHNETHHTSGTTGAPSAPGTTVAGTATTTPGLTTTTTTPTTPAPTTTMPPPWDTPSPWGGNTPSPWRAGGSGGMEGVHDGQNSTPSTTAAPPMTTPPPNTTAAPAPIYACPSCNVNATAVCSEAFPQYLKSNLKYILPGLLGYSVLNGILIVASVAGYYGVEVLRTPTAY